MRKEVEHLYLLGDVFEDYIEYRHVVPKGFVRLQGFLAEWADGGIPITYLVGNHDPWHVDYFERELGVTIIFDDLVADHQGLRIFLSHGDRVALTPMKSWLQGWLRHPVPVWIYRHLVPPDMGIGLARFVSSRFGTRTVDRDLVDRLRVHARHIFSESGVDAVIFGHCHFPELTTWPEGWYLNTGYWHESRTFGRLVDGTLQLMQWNGQTAEIVED
jgi:UDP-2,3-diacylglucosamine hydrolase